MKKQLLFTALLLGLCCATNAQTALDLDGTNDYVSVPSITTTTTFTFEAWVYVRSLPTTGYYTLIEGSNDSPYFGFNNNKLILYLSGSSIVAQDPVDFPLNQWVHVATSCESGNQRLYKNGVEVATGTATTIPTGTSMGIGYNSGDNELDAQIDNVRYWDTIRTATEINTNKDLCLTGTEAGLVVYYQFEDGTGSTTVTDLAGGDNPGTLTNMDPATDWVSTTIGCNTLSTSTYNNSEISLYPNPTTNAINITLKEREDVEIRVTNILGKTVLNKNYNTVNTIRFILNEAAGVYFVSVKNKKGNTKVFKVIKQ